MYLLSRISKCVLNTIVLTLVLLGILAIVGGVIALMVHLLGPIGIILGIVTAAVGGVVFLEEFAD